MKVYSQSLPMGLHLLFSFLLRWSCMVVCIFSLFSLSPFVFVFRFLIVLPLPPVPSSQISPRVPAISLPFPVYGCSFAHPCFPDKLSGRFFHTAGLPDDLSPRFFPPVFFSTLPPVYPVDPLEISFSSFFFFFPPFPLTPIQMFQFIPTAKLPPPIKKAPPPPPQNSLAVPNPPNLPHPTSSQRCRVI